MGDDPIVRFDNYHGPHELHIGGGTFEIEFRGYDLDDDATDRGTLVRRLFERDFERHRETYEKLEAE